MPPAAAQCGFSRAKSGTRCATRSSNSCLLGAIATAAGPGGVAAESALLCGVRCAPLAYNSVWGVSQHTEAWGESKARAGGLTSSLCGLRVRRGNKQR